jgi:hypothetical protein
VLTLLLCRQDDSSTWNDAHGWPPSYKGIINTLEVAHQDFVWRVRKHPRLLQVGYLMQRFQPKSTLPRVLPVLVAQLLSTNGPMASHACLTCTLHTLFYVICRCCGAVWHE